MTFEEFFKKKKIDLPAFEKGEPALFSEFKLHFEEMGEKSFDHTKKYWFNKLRRQFHLATGIKTEKIHIANPLAEQTITESLAETEVPKPSPKLGFVPKFKAGSTPQPANAIDDALTPKAEENTTPKDTIAEDQPAPKPGFQPRFKMKPKTDESAEKIGSEEKVLSEAAEEDDKPKPAYQPRFKMKPKVDETAENIENPIIKEEEVSTNFAENAEKPKPAYQPRFKMKPKVEESAESETSKEPLIEAPDADILPGETEKPKPAYKPKFNMKNLPPKKEE